MSVRRRFALWSAAVVTTCAAAAGIVSALPASAAGGATQDVFIKSGGSNTLSPYAGIFISAGFISLQGDTGSWVVQANVVLVNWGPSDIYRCRLTDADGVQLGASAALVGNGAAAGNGGDGALVVPMSLTGVVNTPSNGNWVNLGCGHDRNGQNGYLDPGVTVWAHRSAALTNS